MNYKFLGNSSLNISEIAFGCMSLHGEEIHDISLVRTAFERGINFFDTADLYDQGRNEILVGRAVKPFRKNIILATKVGNVWNKDGNGWYWDASRKHILEGVNDSLKRLQTDYIDYYQLHGGTIEDNFEEVLEAFELLKEEGKIRGYGISSIRPNVIKHIANGKGLSGVMMQYSLLDRRPEEECLDFLNSRQVGVLARGSLAKGLLVDKPASAYLGYSEEKVSVLQERIKNVGNPLAISLQYVLNNEAVASAVVGFRTDRQLQDVMDVYGTKDHEIDFQAILEGLSPQVYENHR